MAEDPDKTNPSIVLAELRPTQPLPDTKVSAPRSQSRAAVVAPSRVAAAPRAAAEQTAQPLVAEPTPAPVSPPSSVQVDLGSFGREPLNPDYLPQGLNLRGWIIETKIAAGGMGAVYRVRDASESPPLIAALKMSLPPNKQESDAERNDRIRRFEREAGVILGLEHPNILKPSSYFTWQGHPCIVMPFVEGETLKAHCEESHPTLRQVLDNLLIPVADALAYIHRKGIFHRDIKPANIMVRKADGVPLLMDFGIARSRAAATLTQNQLVATLEFGCPEYFMHFGGVRSEYDPTLFEYSPPSDVFCLGATFVEVLTGHLPYHQLVTGEGAAAYMTPSFAQSLVSFEPSPASSLNPQLPAEMDALFLSMMARDPAERLATGDDVIAAVEAFLTAHPAPHPLLDVPFTPPPRKRPGGLGSDEPTPRRRPRAPLPPTRTAPPTPAPAGTAARPRADGTMPPLAPSPSLMVAAPSAGSGFRPPTVAARGQAFQPPQDSDAARAPEAKEPGPSTQLRNAAAFLEGASPRASGSNRTGLYVVAGLALVVVLVLGLAFAATPSPASPAATSLLDAPPPGSDAKSATGAGATSGAPLVEPTPDVAPADAPSAVAEAALAAPPVVTKSSVKKGASADQRAVDALLEQEYGGQRPTLAAGATGAPAKAEPQRPAWLRVSNAVPSAPTAGSGKTFGVPLGTEVSVRLLKPLDSRTIGSGPVVVKLMRPLVVRGAAVFPSGAMAYGTASVAGSSRFDVRFTRLKLADGTEVPFEGIAYDNDDKKPGLRPSSRIQPTGARGAGVGEAVLKGTANALLGKAGGNDAADVARGAGQTILNHEGSAGGSTQEALLLEAPADFVIFVSQAF